MVSASASGGDGPQPGTSAVPTVTQPTSPTTAVETVSSVVEDGGIVSSTSAAAREAANVMLNSITSTNVYKIVSKAAGREVVEELSPKEPHRVMKAVRSAVGRTVGQFVNLIRWIGDGGRVMRDAGKLVRWIGDSLKERDADIVVL